MHIFNVLFFLLGAVFGSFLNALEWRMKNNLSVLSRSMCPRCRNRIFWYENIPILSFIFMRGKCRVCRKKISCQYPVVEIASGIAWALIYYFSQPASDAMSIISIAYQCFLFWLFTFIFIYDLKYGEVLDVFTLIPSIIIFLFNYLLGWNSWQNILCAATVGAGFFAVQYAVSRGKWIGGGDIRIGVLMGAVLGWPNIIIAIMMAYIIGAAVSVILLAFKKKKIGDSTPLGTYLSIATLIVLFFGDIIAKWYISLLK